MLKNSVTPSLLAGRPRAAPEPVMSTSGGIAGLSVGLLCSASSLKNARGGAGSRGPEGSAMRSARGVDSPLMHGALALLKPCSGVQGKAEVDLFEGSEGGRRPTPHGQKRLDNGP